LKFRRIKKKKGDEIPEGINPDVVIEVEYGFNRNQLKSMIL